MKFTAKLQAVKVNSQKQSTYDTTAGSIELVLRVAQPAAPRRPYSYAAEHKLPAEPVRKKGEADVTFQARHDQWAGEKKRHERDLESYRQQMAEYQRAVDSLKPRLLAYAQLAGMGALLGGLDVDITIAPGNQAVLPGFELGELAALAAGDFGSPDAELAPDPPPVDDPDDDQDDQ